MLVAMPRIALALGLSLGLAIAGCRGSKPRAAGSGRLEVACKLEPDRVRCTATNHDVEFRVACVSPYIGIKRTAALVTAKSRACSMFVEPGKAESFDGMPGFRPAETCGADLGGCELRTFDDGSGQAGGDQTLKAVVDFIRELEAAAPDKGSDHPTLAECEGLRKAWIDRPDLKGLRSVLADPDLSAVFCVQFHRGEFDCLRAARTSDELAACPIEQR